MFVLGTNVGILIPDTVSKDARELFEQILCQMTSFIEQKVPPGVSAEEERAKMAQSAGERIAEGLVAGRAYAAESRYGPIFFTCTVPQVPNAHLLLT